MQSWAEIFSGFKSLKILIVGDVMLDSYVWGVVNRISPEAPIPIVNVQKRDFRLGGAANVALNIHSLGATPILCALLGNDISGNQLLELLQERNLSKEGIVISKNRKTTTKTRIISGHQHIVRVDDETDIICDEEEEEHLLRKIEKLLPTCDAIVFEDYDKGVISQNLIEKTVTQALDLNIPTIVDPKKRNFHFYKRVTLFKPNLKELREGLKIDIEASDNETIVSAINSLKHKLQIEGVLLTLSEHGIYLDYKHQEIKLPAVDRKIIDVSGAGDSVVSIATLCVALKLEANLIALLSNLTGGIVCKYIGVVPINPDELLKEVTEVGG